MTGRFVLKTAKGGKFHFNLHAGNGQVILTSPSHVTKRSAVEDITAVVRHAGEASSIDRRVATNGKAYFNLKASDGRVIGKSQMYSSKAAMERGIRSVAINAGSPIDDQAPRASTDLTGVPAEIADDPDRVRSWLGAQADLQDPEVRSRVMRRLERLAENDATMTKAEFLAATERATA